MLEKSDSIIARLIKEEIKRERETINLIASENYVSKNVLSAVGSILTNKYAEGYPGRRYYDGCENIDEIESVAIRRALRLFKAEHANVQPHAGSQANMAVYLSVLKPGDVILGMDLASGGHLTHGTKINFSGTIFKPFYYGVNRETEQLDYDEIFEIAQRTKPRMIICGASAYPRLIDFKRFYEMAKNVGAYLCADIAHIAGLIVAGLHPSPVAYAEFVTGTTHKTLRGPRGGFILCKREFAQLIDKAVFPGIQGGPLMHVIAGKAVAFKEAMGRKFRLYQKNVVSNCSFMAKGFVEMGYRLVSGGTDNHLLLLDLRNKKITGDVAQKVLGSVGITVNKNVIPFDPLPPNIASGIRIGTAAITTRGMGKTEIKKILEFIDEALSASDKISELRHIKKRVKRFASQFPIYAE
ncbi:MAG: serine hydroxymethyltransferase [Candidatus Omnitrophica bacterium]|nr:serine hydroxymethyltransferase [Candidatus Omnitrophota bacterium]MCM8816100.1 serine hydroxymethyltransferase [Candidatus Omnitrophota bacterium]